MSSSPILVDLKVNHNLIDPKFESYRLSSQDVVFNCHSLVNSIDEFTLEDKSLYSYLHFSAFTRDFNYLFTDPFDDQQELASYYVDNHGKLWKIKVNPDDDNFAQPICLFNLTEADLNIKPNDCLISLSFPSPNYLLILFYQSAPEKRQNGQLVLLIVATGDRTVDSTTSWSLIDNIDLTDCTTFGQCWSNETGANAKQLVGPGKLIISFCQPKESRYNEDKLDLIVMTVNKNEDDKFEVLFTWLTLIKSEDPQVIKPAYKWTVGRLRQLNGSTYPSYFGVDHFKGEPFLTIASERFFEFSFDSEKASNEIESLEVEKGADEKNDKDDNCIYLFRQNGPEITVDFKLTKDIESRHVHVDFVNNELEIRVKGERVFKKPLWAEIDKEGCTWTLDKNWKSSKLSTTSEESNVALLQITLTKRDENLVWNQLIKGEEKGFEMSNDESNVYKGLSLLASQMGSIRSVSGQQFVPSLTGNEQCDEVSEDLALCRYDFRGKQLTHQVNLGGHQWLFSRTVSDCYLPCFAIRHDIDALIWQPTINSGTGSFQVNHIATFSALGYVQASKESKKFFNCSPDFDYAFIADSTNHVYIYKQPSVSEGLTNRKAGIRAKIAKQRVVNLGNDVIKVLGASAFNGYLVILSSNKIFSIKTNF